MSVKVIQRGSTEIVGNDVTVFVFERNKYARVDWDFFRLPEENDDFFRENAKEMSEISMQIYLSVATKKSEYNGNGLVGHMDYLPIESAHATASALSNLFEDFVNRRVLLAT